MDARTLLSCYVEMAAYVDSQLQHYGYLPPAGTTMHWLQREVEAWDALRQSGHKVKPKHEPEAR